MNSFNRKILALQILTVAVIATARPLPTLESRLNIQSDIAARLRLDDGETSCWTSLFQLHSCTGEVIKFFVNGETYIGPTCCRAIWTIEHECWPDMLKSLGYTPEESDILRGFCDRGSLPPESVLAPPVTSPEGLLLSNMLLPSEMVYPSVAP